MKVFLEDKDASIASMFEEHGYSIVTEQEKADIVCFGGGDDVSPALYGEVNTSSYTNHKRDMQCIYMYNKARTLGQVCVGICRGGQFLHVMNGFKLHQHIEGHRGTMHKVKYAHDFPEIEDFSVTSDHHQSMSISGAGYLYPMLLAEDGTIECVVHTNDRGRVDICYQPHPEWVHKDHPCRTFFFELIKSYEL